MKKKKRNSFKIDYSGAEINVTKINAGDRGTMLTNQIVKKTIILIYYT